MTTRSSTMSGSTFPDDVPPMPGAESATFTGQDVVDETGDKLGTVADVISDPSTLQPRWLVVDTGRFKASHYVPVDVAARTMSGDVVVPFNREALKRAPKAGRDHVLTSDDERQLREYYRLTG
jgi:hypothetical protein